MIDNIKYLIKNVKIINKKENCILENDKKIDYDKIKEQILIKINQNDFLSKSMKNNLLSKYTKYINYYEYNNNKIYLFGNNNLNTDNIYIHQIIFVFIGF